eukprot:jgi/Bigna1/90713/estExt_fgenesh1_pg.C_770070
MVGAHRAAVRLCPGFLPEIRDLDEEETEALIQEVKSEAEFSPSHSLLGGRMTAGEEIKLILSGALIFIAVAAFTYPIGIGLVLQEELEGCKGKFTLYNKYSGKARHTYEGIDLPTISLAESIIGIVAGPAWGYLVFFARHFHDVLHLKTTMGWYVLCFLAQFYLFMALCQNLGKWNENVDCGGNEDRIKDAVSGFIISGTVSICTSFIVVLGTVTVKYVFLV